MPKSFQRKLKENNLQKFVTDVIKTINSKKVIVESFSKDMI